MTKPFFRHKATILFSAVDLPSPTPDLRVAAQRRLPPDLDAAEDFTGVTPHATQTIVDTWLTNELDVARPTDMLCRHPAISTTLYQLQVNRMLIISHENQYSMFTMSLSMHILREFMCAHRDMLAHVFTTASYAALLLAAKMEEVSAVYVKDIAKHTETTQPSEIRFMETKIAVAQQFHFFHVPTLWMFVRVFLATAAGLTMDATTRDMVDAHLHVAACFQLSTFFLRSYSAHLPSVLAAAVVYAVRRVAQPMDAPWPASVARLACLAEDEVAPVAHDLIRDTQSLPPCFVQRRFGPKRTIQDKYPRGIWTMIREYCTEAV